MRLMNRRVLKQSIILALLLALTLPLSSLSSWDMTKSYVEGDEVIFNSVVWRAKWWSLNEVPGRFEDSAWEKVEELYDYSDNVAPSKLPPGGLTPEEVPMFILIGSDDNFRPDGMHWLLDYIGDKENADGSPVKISFFNPAIEMKSQAIIDAWSRAVEEGHELANHTFDHQKGGKFSLEKWLQQLYDTNMRFIAPAPSGLGAYESQIKGIRVPHLDYNSNTFKAIKELHMLYDSSIEEGWQLDQDGTNYFWPYTLDNGSPVHDQFVKHGLKEPIEPAPGVWELPIYTLLTPTDADCIKLGIKPGLRDRCAPVNWWYAISGYKISGLDYNILYEYGLTEEEHYAILKYNFDRRVAGNRAPFIYGIHSNMYTDQANKRVLAKFIDYALSHEEVRFVTKQQFIEWMRNPTALGSQ